MGIQPCVVLDYILFQTLYIHMSSAFPFINETGPACAGPVREKPLITFWRDKGDVILTI